MSRIAETLRNKDRIEKEIKKHRKEELKRLKKETMFSAKVHEMSCQLREIFNDSDIESIILEIDDKSMAYFTNELYKSELYEFSIEQIEANRFKVSRREISI